MRALAVGMTLLVSIAATEACGASRTRPGSEPRTSVVIDNQSFTDMTIYLVEGGAGGQRIRLGRATGKAKTELRIPPSVLRSPREVQFLADPIASNRTSVSERLFISPGEQVSLVIYP